MPSCRHVQLSNFDCNDSNYSQDFMRSFMARVYLLMGGTIGCSFIWVRRLNNLSFVFRRFSLSYFKACSLDISSLTSQILASNYISGCVDGSCCTGSLSTTFRYNFFRPSYSSSKFLNYFIQLCSCCALAALLMLFAISKLTLLYLSVEGL